MRSGSNYQVLLTKLDEFIRKYYKNLMIRGFIYSLSAILASLLVIDILEFYFYFSGLTRAFLFYSFLSGNAILSYLWFITPLLSFYKLGKVISLEQAAHIIGTHFESVNDKLLNTLQLNAVLENSPQAELIEASISQKIDQLKPIPFSKAINLQENKKYLKFLALPFSIILILIFTAPSVLTDSSNRIMKYNTFFSPVAPFEFNMVNKELKALQGEDFTLEVKMSGKEIPAEIFLVEGDNRNSFEKSSTINFQYHFKNLNKSKRFRLYANGFYSSEMSLTVLPKPNVLNFDLELSFPAYIHRKNEKIKNNGDLNIPAGTTVKWLFFTENTNRVALFFDGKKEMAEEKDNNQFSFSKRFVKNSFYSLKPENNFSSKSDSIAYSINVIPDLYPTIILQERKDSSSSRLYYFVGSVKDDYGFRNMNFNYKITQSERTDLLNKVNSIIIPLNKNNTENAFFYSWNLADIGILPGEDMEYYFEVWDNDAVNGSKSTRSEIKTFKAPTVREIEKQTDENHEALKDKLAEAQKKALEIQKETKRLSEKLINKKEISFDEKKAIQDLMQKEKELENQVREIQKSNSNNNQQESEYKETEERIAEKKKELEDIFNNALDEKTKEMIQRLEKLLEQNNKNYTQEELEKFKMSNENLEKELDRMLELYKQLEFEQKFSEITDKLDKLQEKQDQLNQKTEDQKESSEKLKDQQDMLNKEFKEVEEDMKELDEKNKELEDKNEFQNPEEDLKDIDKDMQNSSGQLQSGSKKQASKSQKSASSKMKKLSDKMKQMQEEMEEEMNEENLKALRDVLENLIKISFEEESTMQELKTTNINDPKFLSLTQKQKSLKDDIAMVKDSLFMLSKKIAQLSSYVNKEITAIDQNLEKVINNLADRRVPDAINRQQVVMTSVNNLALILSEVLDQMQQQMMEAQSKPGKGNKPSQGKGKGKGGKKSLESLSKMQQKLNEQMKEMQKGMKPGQGKGQGQGQGQMSEQMARMAQQQQAIRNALQEISKSDNKDGKGKLGNLDQLAKEMEKTEKDIYNKMINPETIKRQQEIMTRLLEAENAEKQREQDNKRESKEGKDKTYNMNIAFEEFKKLKQKELELYRTVPPVMNSFYKDKVNDYFKQLNKTN